MWYHIGTTALEWSGRFNHAAGCSWWPNWCWFEFLGQQQPFGAWRAILRAVVSWWLVLKFYAKSPTKQSFPTFDLWFVWTLWMILGTGALAKLGELYLTTWHIWGLIKYSGVCPTPVRVDGRPESSTASCTGCYGIVVQVHDGPASYTTPPNQPVSRAQSDRTKIWTCVHAFWGSACGWLVHYTYSILYL